MQNTSTGSVILTPRFMMSSKKSSVANVSNVYQVVLQESPCPVPATKARHGGKTRDEIWKYFRQIDQKQWECKQCLQYKVKCPQADRLKKHYFKCLQSHATPSEDFELPTDLSLLTSSVQLHNAPSSEEVIIVSTPTTNAVHAKKIKLSDIKIATAEATFSKEKADIDFKLMKLICSANLSFDIVENSYFLSFVNALKSSYSLPTTEEISSTLLDSLFENVKNEAMKSINGKKAVVIQDVASSLQTEDMMVHSMFVNYKTYFLSATGSNEDTRSVTFCLQKMQEAICQAEEFGTNVIGCITNNGSDLLTLTEFFQDKKPNFIIYYCNIYLFDQLASQMISTEFRSKIVEVQRFFKNYDFSTETFNGIDGILPINAGDSNWNSLLECFWSYFNNQSKYLDILSLKPESSGTENEIVRNIIENNEVLLQVQMAFEVLKPIVCALENLQHDNSTVADGVACWLQVKEELGHHANDIFDEKFQQGTPIISVVAYMLHPCYRGKGLDSTMREKGRIWLGDQNPYFVSISMALTIGDAEYFPASMLDEILVKSINPSTWWATAFMDNPSKFPKDFQDLVDNLMRLPSCTTGIKNSYSSMINIAADCREGVSLEKVNKMCFIRHALKK